MTDRDPALQAAIDRAVRALATRLRPFADAMKDPDAFARQYVTDLYDEGWRPWPRPPVITQHARPGDYRRGAEEAREALREAKARTAGDPLGLKPKPRPEGQR
jgi:hypothetical protein